MAAVRGDLAFDGKDYTGAARHLRIACIRKAANSCTRLGWLYQNGYGVAQSNLQAIALYRRELAFRPRHPSAYPNFIKAQDDFNKSPAGYNAYPSVSKNTENILRQLIIGDSKYWLSSTFNPTSLKNVRLISGQEGSSTWSVRADFSYGSYPNQLGGAADGWVVAEFWGNSLYCFQFNDTEGCRDMYTPENQQGFRFGPAFFRNSTASEVAQGCRLDGNRCQGDK